MKHRHGFYLQNELDDQNVATYETCSFKSDPTVSFRHQKNLFPSNTDTDRVNIMDPKYFIALKEPEFQRATVP